MTVITVTAEQIFPGDANNTAFVTTISLADEDTLFVWRVDEAGSATPLIQDVDFTIGNLTSNTGVTVNYPVTGDPLPRNSFLFVQRQSPLTQTSDFILERGYSPEAIEQELDRLSRVTQELTSLLKKVPQFRLGYTATTPRFTVGEAGQILRWRDDGTLENIDIPNSLEGGTVGLVKRVKRAYVGDGVSTEFDLGVDAFSKQLVSVKYEGLDLAFSAYELGASRTTIILAEPLPAGSYMELWTDSPALATVGSLGELSDVILPISLTAGSMLAYDAVQQAFTTVFEWGDILQNIERLGINTTADTTNRLAVASPASLFTHEGAGHQLKVNKATTGDTAGLLFQVGFSGRAEMGLAGEDDFSIKVSDDGSTWRDAIDVEAATGLVDLRLRQLTMPELAPVLVIASDEITITGTYHVIDTQGAATTDVLQTINGGNDGDVLMLRIANNSRHVHVRSEGNIELRGGRVQLTDVEDRLVLQSDGTNWYPIAVWEGRGRFPNYTFETDTVLTSWTADASPPSNALANVQGTQYVRSTEVDAASPITGWAFAKPRVGDGTLAAPGVRFGRDPDTGLHRPADNAISLVAGGVEVLRLTSAGAPSGSAVQATIADAIANKLMLNGAHGIGAISTNPPPIVTLATATTTGIFTVGAGDASKPWAAAVGGIVLITRTGASWVRQETTQANASVAYERFTTDNGSTWSPWRLQYHQNTVLGTVTESAGVPTGALIERGSNANGDYVRFADGTQICGTTVQGDTGGAFVRTWPAEFAAAPRIGVVGTSGTAPRIVTIANNTVTSIDVHIWDTAGARTNAFAGIIGFGRWF